MKRKTIITIPLTLLAAIVAVGWLAAPSVQAHTGTASGTCQGGVQWAYTNYDKTVVNTITVTIDGTVRYQDLDFKASDTGTIATDKTVAHTWDVAVNAPGTQYDKHPSGSYGACVAAPTTTAPTTTVAPTTTTVAATTTVPATTVPDTTVPEATTTSVVAVDIPPVPTTAAPVILGDGIALTPAVEPVLPITGGMGTALIVVACGCLIVGAFLVVRGRRVQ